VKLVATVVVAAAVAVTQVVAVAAADIPVVAEVVVDTPILLLVEDILPVAVVIRILLPVVDILLAAVTLPAVAVDIQVNHIPIHLIHTHILQDIGIHIQDGITVGDGIIIGTQVGGIPDMFTHHGFGDLTSQMVTGNVQRLTETCRLSRVSAPMKIRRPTERSMPAAEITTKIMVVTSPKVIANHKSNLV
jgi:hypothetical protein